METRHTQDVDESTSERQSGSTRSSGLGKRLDPALKSWMDNVIIPALVREYLAEIEKRNRLATTGNSEVKLSKDFPRSVDTDPTLFLISPWLNDPDFYRAALVTQ